MKIDSNKTRIMYSELVTLLPKNSKKCTIIATCIIVQCIIVIVAGTTVLQCAWSPDHALFEFDELARILYLYDFRACRPSFNFSTVGVSDVQLSTETYGLPVFPIEWQQVILTPMTKTPSSTRSHMKISIGLHVIWMIIAWAVLIVRYNRSIQLKKVRLVLGILYYATLIIILYDVSMALLYAAHIQRSLTKGMILRYSGRRPITDKSSENTQFAGWVPITASICWLRGLVFFAVNIYFVRNVHYVRSKISKRLFQKNRLKGYHTPFPEAKIDESLLDDPSVLYYKRDQIGSPIRKSSSLSSYTSKTPSNE